MSIYDGDQRQLISIHAPREGGDGIFADTPCANTGISIHAPREGGDTQLDLVFAFPKPISIHAPREGGDSAVGTARRSGLDFNPRPPRGGRRRLEFRGS